MKKQIALVLTLAAFLISAWDDGYPGRPTPPAHYNTKPELVIYSIHPNAGAPGTTVAILGANFGTAISDNHVAFGSSSAEITHVGYGVITVHVPNVPEGDYEINVTAGGQARRAPQMFTIDNSQR